MAVRRRAGSAVGQHLHDRGIHFLAGEGGEAFLGCLGDRLVGIAQQFDEHRERRGIADLRERADGRETNGLLAAPGGGEQSGQGRIIAALGEGLDQQDLPVGGKACQFTRQEAGDFRTRHFLRGADGGAGPAR